MMTLRTIGRRALGSAALLALGAVGVLGGGLVARVDLVTATGEGSPCERDRCEESSGACIDAEQALTSCNLHEFGCGTLPCGMSAEELASFEDDNAAEIWMAWGPKAIETLVPLAAVEGERSVEGARMQALETLAAMAQEWDADKLPLRYRDELLRLAVAYTRKSVEGVAPGERAASLMRGIDLSMALSRDLDHPYYRESVRLLENPDTVRARLGDMGGLPDSEIQEVARYAVSAR